MSDHFRRAAKTDANQKQIVKELRQLGYRVDVVSQLKGMYDLVITGNHNINCRAATVRVEIKMPGEGLSDKEKEYHDTEPFPGTLIIAHSTEEIIDWFWR